MFKCNVGLVRDARDRVTVVVRVTSSSNIPITFLSSGMRVVVTGLLMITTTSQLPYSEIKVLPACWDRLSSMPAKMPAMMSLG